MPSEQPPHEPTQHAAEPLEAQMVEWEQKLMFQQRAYEQLNAVVLEQQAELAALRREVNSLRQALEGIRDSGLGEDLPHEKPPHY